MEKKYISALLIVGVSALLASCQKNDSTGSLSSNDDSAGILNGTEATSSDLVSKSVVKITHDLPGNMYGICTGTLVEKRYVVTAAHCLQDNQGSLYTGVTVLFPASKIQTQGIPMKASVIHPLYQKVARYADDVALILLTSDAPADYVPAVVPSSFVDLSSLVLYEAGYGRTMKSEIEKRNLSWVQVYLQKDEVAKPDPYQTFFRPNSRENRKILLSQPLVTSPGFCFGDSGGPLYYLEDSKLVLLGVNSTVQNENCTGMATVSSVTYFRRFFAKAFDLLQKVDGSLGDSKIPAWENMNFVEGDSQNIEIWRQPNGRPLELQAADQKYIFKRARLVSAAATSMRMFNGGDNDELQISTDPQFDCLSTVLGSDSAPTMAIPLMAWPARSMIETDGKLLTYVQKKFVWHSFKFQIFDLKSNSVQFNVMNVDNSLASVSMSVLDCRNLTPPSSAEVK